MSVAHGGRPWRVLVTGGSGFIGTNLVDFYSAAGAEVLNLDAVEPRNPDHVDLWRQADLLDANGFRDLVSEFDPTHVIHMAARTDLTGRDLGAYRANTTGLANAIEAFRGARSLERIVFASSRMVCEIGYRPRNEADYCPPNAYGASKVEGERIVRQAEIATPWIVVRPTSIWGPWFDVPYRDFFVSVARGRYVHVGHRRVRKSFGFVGNSVHQIDRLLSATAESIHGRTIYLADYPPLEVSSWAEEVRRQLGARPIRRLPYPLLKAAAIAGDGLQRAGWQNVPLTQFRLANLLTEMVYDLEPLAELVGELPFPLEKGVAATVAWLRREERP